MRILTPVLLVGALLLTAANSFCTQDRTTQAEPITNVRSSSLTFTKNMGQWPDSILYRTNACGATVWLTSTGVIYQFTRRVERSAVGQDPRDPDMAFVDRNPRGFDIHCDSVETMLIQASFVDANPNAEVVPEGLTEYKCNYFLGNDPAKWRTDVPNYSTVTIKSICPGVDAVFRGRDEGIECEYLATSAGELAQVKVEYLGAHSVSIQQDNSAILTTNLGEMRFDGVLPVSDSISARRALTANAASPRSLSLVYSTYLGGGDDQGWGIAVDSSRCAYVNGFTYSSSFPIQDPLDGSLSGVVDAFVTKLSANGNGLVYSTYLGGESVDASIDIAVDGSGCAYVIGLTASPDFPIHNAYDGSLNGSGDVFVTKLSAAGNVLVYSTYLGGGQYDEARSLAIDSSGCAYIAGITHSPDFPMQNPFDGSMNDTIDVFVTKLSAAGNTLLYSTYIGGGSPDQAFGIAVDKTGCAYVTGRTSSSNFPTQNPYDMSYNGNADAFVAKLSAAGNGLLYSTYLGGGSSDYGYGIAVDGSGCAYITGHTSSTNFPTQSPFDVSYNGGDDAFVAKLSAAGNGLLYSTYLGGGDFDDGANIAVDNSGDVYVTGYTSSLDFPTLNPYDGSYSGGQSDAFVTKLLAAGNELEYSTYLGGEYRDAANGIAIDDAGHAYVTGLTSSSDFPTRNPYDGSFSGDLNDAFVTKIGALSCCEGVTGNVNMSGIVDLSDLSALVSYLTGGGYVPPCPEEANVNNVGIVDLSDLSALVSYLTGGGYALPPCP